MKVWLCLFILPIAANILVLAQSQGCNIQDPECGYNPVGYCDVRQNTTFNSAAIVAYISICADNLTLNCNEASIGQLILNNVHGNNVKNCRVTWSGFYLNGNSSYNIIMNNAFTDLDFNSGVQSSVNTHNNFYSDNTFIRNKRAITIYGRNETITRNSITQGNLTSIRIIGQNAAIIGNTITHALNSGMNLEASGAYVTNNTVLHSRVHGIESDGINSISNNIFCANMITDLRNAAGTGTPIIGYNNTCDIAYDWNDTNAIGCQYSCDPRIEITGSSQIGNTIELNLINPLKASQQYIAGLSLGTVPGILLRDGRTIPLNNDQLFQISLDPYLNQVYNMQNLQGVLNGNGRAVVSITLPNSTFIANLPIYVAFAISNPSLPLPQMLINISNATEFTILP